MCSLKNRVCSKLNTSQICDLVVKNNVQQCAIHFQLAIVIDETQFPEFIHERTDTRPGRADYIRERILANLWHDWLRHVVLAEIC